MVSTFLCPRHTKDQTKTSRHTCINNTCHLITLCTFIFFYQCSWFEAQLVEQWLCPQHRGPGFKSNLWRFAACQHLSLSSHCPSLSFPLQLSCLIKPWKRPKKNNKWTAKYSHVTSFFHSTVYWQVFPISLGERSSALVVSFGLLLILYSSLLYPPSPWLSVRAFDVSRW